MLTLGNVEVTSGAKAPNRLAILLWGPAACGKTTFAATAPGKKLWLSFGDNEHVSVMHRKDVIVANLSDMTVEELFKHAQNENPFGLDQFLAKQTEVETVVCDSLTAIAFKALQKAVADKIGAGKGFTPTMEAPGISAYGGRNAIVLVTLTGLLRVTAKHNVHIIITAHEADPVMNDQGVIEYISVMLGGQLVNNMSWRLSEIWHMSQDTTKDKVRRIAIRPTRRRRPMKTRMFSDKGEPDFQLRYDADKADKGQMTIADWYEKARDGVRLPIPK